MIDSPDSAAGRTSSPDRPMGTTSRKWRAWAVPVAVAAFIAAVTMAPRAFAANPHPHLPAKSAAQLIAAVDATSVQTLSGTFKTSAHLGLPQLPDNIGGGTNGLTSLLTGASTVRVWVGGPTEQRVALLGNASEMDAIRNGRDLWTWNSTTQSVLHAILPAHQADSSAPASPAQELTPAQQARQVLKNLDPSTSVTVGRSARVAGRPAYLLTLTPKTTRTLVGRVQIAIDSATSVPLGVWLYPRGSSTAAFSTAFSSVSFGKPAASTFRFTPPRGATVTQKKTSGLQSQSDGRAHHATASDSGPKVLGTGWASIVEFPSGSVSDASGTASGKSSSSLLNEVTNPVAGGRLLTTRLLSVMLTDDGRVLIGAVPGSVLQTLAGSTGP
jgi:outer membrane lipoprotein-sorting protein